MNWIEKNSRLIFIIFLGFVSTFLINGFSRTFLQLEDLNLQTALIKPATLIRQEKNQKNILVAVGDIMLSRHVGTKIKEAGDESLPFKKTFEYLIKGDITFGNLEAPFYNQGPIVKEGMVFKAEPETIAGLKLAGFDIVSLANNHSKNKGKAGLLYTIDYLKQNEIEPVGAGKNFSEAHEAVIIQKNNIKFGFLAYTYSDGVNYEPVVSKDQPDVAFLDIEQMKKDVKEAKKEADIVIVSMHAGLEYKSRPELGQINFAHSAIDSGADLVLGHHPHVVQSVEQYKNGFIIYSLGNFVFDQMWSKETKEGLVVECEFSGKKLKKVEFLPVIIENYNQPRWVSAEEAKKVLENMGLEKAIIEL